MNTTRTFIFRLAFVVACLWAAGTLGAREKTAEGSRISTRTTWTKSKLEAASIRFETDAATVWAFTNSDDGANAGIRFANVLLGPLRTRRGIDRRVGFSIVAPTQKMHWGAAIGVGSPIQAWYVETTRTSTTGVQASISTPLGSFWGSFECETTGRTSSRVWNGGYSWTSKRWSSTLAAFKREEELGANASLSFRAFGTWTINGEVETGAPAQGTIRHRFEIPIGNRNGISVESTWTTNERDAFEKTSLEARWKSPWGELGYRISRSRKEDYEHRLQARSSLGSFDLLGRSSVRTTPTSWETKSLVSVGVRDRGEDDDLRVWLGYDWKKDSTNLEAGTHFGVSFSSYDRSVRVDVVGSTECLANDFWSNPRVTATTTIRF